MVLIQETTQIPAPTPSLTRHPTSEEAGHLIGR